VLGFDRHIPDDTRERAVKAQDRHLQWLPSVDAHDLRCYPKSVSEDPGVTAP
jgi:hypothetical protein